MKKLVATLILLFISALLAQAHSSLLSSNPAANATVVDFPMDVTLTFNEELLVVGADNPNKVEVIDDMGNLVSGVTVVAGTNISAPVEPAEDGSNLLIRIVVLAALGFGIFISFRKANS